MPLGLGIVIRSLKAGCCLHPVTAQPAQLCSVAMFWKERAVYAVASYTLVMFSLNFQSPLLGRMDLQAECTGRCESINMNVPSILTIRRLILCHLDGDIR